VPIEIQSVAPATAPRPGIGWGGLALRRPRVTTRERMFFTERLALLLETGSPLHASLDALRTQAAGPLSEVVGALRESVGEGTSFSQALARHPTAFPSTYVNLVAAGEGGGFLPEVLHRLQEMDERREELRSTLVSALSYPAFLIFFSLAVVVFVLAVVFPKFDELFATIRDQLPATTLLLMAMSDGIRSYGVHALVALAALGVLAWRWLATDAGGAALDRLTLRLPLVRDVAVQLYLVQFLHVMSLSLANGVGMLDALRSCRGIVRSRSFRAFVGELETNVTQGRGLASGFREAEFLPALARHMVTTGEETGRLPLVMGRVADFYQREWSKRLTTLSKLAEPAMLLVMGVVVGLIVSSLILPIFKLSRAVR
jgi:type II secretory pathway component PulF